MTEPQTPKQQAAEAAAIRRRWITLGEVLAVVAVLISALTLWNSYADRKANEGERASEQKSAGAKAATLALKSTVADEGRALTLTPVRVDQVVQSQTISFPSALGVAPIDTTGDARIEAGWFGEALKKARRAAGLDEKPKGDARLPILIVTRFLADGVEARDVSVYDLGYGLDGRLIGGATVRLRGVSLIGRMSEAKSRERIDTLWQARSRSK